MYKLLLIVLALGSRLGSTRKLCYVGAGVLPVRTELDRESKVLQ